MKWYVLTSNTVLNRGKAILAGPFISQQDADDVARTNGFKWGRTFTECLCDDVAGQLTKGVNV